MADLTTLGATIAQLSETVASLLAEGNHEPPSFAADGPESFPKNENIEQTRQQLLEAVRDLQHLIEGPKDHVLLWGSFWSLHDPTILRVLLEFDFFSAVPLDGSASYAEIAHKTSLPQTVVRRILGYAFTMRFFAPHPTNPERIIHTGFSAYISRTPSIRSWLGLTLNSYRMAGTKLADALAQFTFGHDEPSQDPSESSAGLVARLHGHEGADYYAHTAPTLCKEFAGKMTTVTELALQSKTVLTEYPWAKLGNATVVDVGGSEGTLAKGLAKQYPNLRFIVQDLPRLESLFNDKLPTDLEGRVTFQAQDFFKPQPQLQDVFLMRHILHNWPDEHAMRIWRNLAQALKPGGRILVVDITMPEAHETASLPLNVQKGLVTFDIVMMTLFNAPERRRGDWDKLAAGADRRLRLANVYQQEGEATSLLEYVLDG